VAHELIASLPRKSSVEQSECRRRPGRVLERFVVRPGRSPSLVEIDEEPSVLPVDTARQQCLQHVSS
jgi:hypothetical protein